ncbi:unnamed protein product, partial [Rotaria magnacalcarata]
MSTARQVHTASILANGQVIVAGGSNSVGILNSAELYDTLTGLWTRAGNMTIAR